MGLLIKLLGCFSYNLVILKQMRDKDDILKIIKCLIVTSW